MAEAIRACIQACGIWQGGGHIKECGPPGSQVSSQMNACTSEASDLTNEELLDSLATETNRERRERLFQALADVLGGS